MIESIGPWAVAIGVAAAVFLLRAAGIHRSQRDRERLADDAVLAQMVVVPPERTTWFRALLVALGAGALAAAATGVGTADPERSPDGDAETVLVLDASNSMLARDVLPSRLEIQRQIARSLATRLPGKVAVVYFAGRGYVLSPLTTDMNAIAMFIDAVRPASVGRGGSSLAAGITQALDLLGGGEEVARKAVVLISDGEETVGQPMADAIERAVEGGVEISSIGIGTDEGGPILLTRDAAVDPSTSFSRRQGETYLRGPDGEIVVTRLEEAALRTLSEETGGSYMIGTSDNLAALIASITADGAQAVEAGSGMLSLLLLAGFVLLWGEAFLFSRG